MNNFAGDMRVPLALIFVAVVLSGCRMLTERETTFLSNIYSNQVAYDAVRLHSPFSSEKADERRLERALKREVSTKQSGQLRGLSRSEFVNRSFAAMRARPEALVLGNSIYYARTSYRSDFAEGFPRQVVVDELSLLAHEMVHVWQHQNRERTGYSLLAVALEHLSYKRPYDYVITPGKAFLSYRFEQQGRIMQDYVFLAFQEAVLNRQDRSRLRQLRELLETEFDLDDIRSELIAAVS
ncbi:hypothetical protein [Hoeflea sp.]|uniref:hypothetical protein n=1 Tax=Hoeflea sp. TaxID=1940281 RepID=UPI003748785A